MSVHPRTPSVHPRPHALPRLAAAAALALGATVLAAGPARAHAHVTAAEARALAENVTLTFTSEAENPSAGFTELRVELPDGIEPSAVELKKAPKGWKLKATDGGYRVAGPETEAGTDAEYQITVRQLPDARKLAFKTVETYGDGTVARWIEISDGGDGHGDGHDSGQPAPVLELKPAAPGAEPVDPGDSGAEDSDDQAGAATAAAPEPSATVAEDTATADGGAEEAERTAAAGEDSGSSVLPLAAGAVGVLALGGGAWWFLRRRSAADAG
ncbi:DUF1775 domain-containing protein [Streptomyces albus]|uniref:DUF1775 domain-containing protein n=1 Tax=Streptomyces albus TaxID=1888 RepID=UPI0004CAB755|nr:DUF1775 domain-containing protein [Streptomyces albus]